MTSSSLQGFDGIPVRGAGIWHWLSECPMPVFMASIELLGPVQAWDTLRETRAITLGGGRLKKQDAQRAFSELERQAGKLRQPAEKGCAGDYG